MAEFIFHFSDKIYYTRHVKKRMRWRNISHAEVAMTTAAPQRKEKIEENKYHFFRTVGKKLIRVTLVKENKKIIVISVVDKNN